MPVSKYIAKRNKMYLKQLRRNATTAEIIFRDYLIEKRVRFIFQKGFFKPFHRILDFYLPGRRIGFEVDGSSHIGKEQKDRNKDSWFATSRNLYVYRITNEEVYSGKFKEVLRNLGIC